MSKMGLLGAIGFSLALVSLTQIPYSAEGCEILSATASGPSSILVKWDKHVGATNYFLDLRVKNNTNVAPVVVTLSSSMRQKDVMGLRPGTEYDVTLKVFQFYFVVCIKTTVASTVPDMSQVEVGRALSSTSIRVEWEVIPSANHYYLLVRSQSTGETLNLTLTSTSAVVENLQPSTNYDCYVYTANQAGLGGRSKVRTITTLMQPPVNITVTQTGRNMARVMWQPVEDVLIYRVTVQDTSEPGSHWLEFNVSDTRLDVHSILPCSTYLISVSSFNTFLVPSEPTVYSYTTNKLTPVSSVTVDYTCATHSATVSWSAVFGAESYKATAMGANGSELTCSSQHTTCRITGLSCGQSYVVHVTPMSDSCRNIHNTTSATFHTVPCPPTNLQLLRDCSSEVIVFSWDHTNNTDHYMAKAVDTQGLVQDCLTDDNSCYFTNTMCGRHYHFTVYSIRNGCRSNTSSTVDIRTAPCIPQNLQTLADCGTDVLLSKWDLAEGALRYTVEAFGNRGNSTYNCTSASNSCAIEGMHCGEHLSVYITAFDDECASPRTLGPVAETVPCAPQNVSAVRECGADSITVTWDRGSAIFYIAFVRDSDGATHSCNSLTSSCTIEGLRCSTPYTAYVIASNFMCNSTESEMVTIETASCPPDQVTARLDCTANEALVSWRGEPTMKSFTASIVDEDEGLLSCSSINTSCSIPNLKCGRLYSVTVRYHDGMCPSMPSEAIYMESVPCGPNVNASLDCQTQVLTLGWNPTSNAQGYTAVISNNNGQMSYNTTEPALTINTLECGLDYTLRVTSFNGTCVSHPSVLPVSKTPCVPTNVTVTRNCGQTSTLVTWRASRGALSYQAAATSEAGQRLVCSSNGTSCRLEGLMCSQVYRVGVTAMGNNCTSNESTVVLLETAPCPPSQFNASMSCVDNSARLSWSSSPNAVSYTGKAASRGGHVLTCHAGLDLGCQLHGLQCGQEYTFTVSSSDGGCQSPDSEPVVHATAPCVVEDVSSTLNCSSNMLTVGWVPGPSPVNYSATATARDGTTLRCVTQDSSCTMSSLRCGQQYTVTVRAASSTCQGNGSVPQTVNSVPCVPVNVRGLVNCSTNTLQASWDAAAGAASYITTMTGLGGFSSSCHALNQSCLFPELQCAQTYTFSVLALNDRCNSSESARVSARAAPCDPTNVAAALNCVSGVAMVTWRSSAGASYYTVLAEAGGHVDSCTSNGTSCELTQLQCGEDYTVTVLAGDGDCNSSVLARTNVTTAPCAPVIRDHSFDCATNNALVTWVKDEDAMSVEVIATSSQGQMTSCNSSTNSSCVLEGLECGHRYSIQAVAQGVQCLSRPSSTFQIVTAPCTPANVEHTYSCDTGIALLSWDETLGRQSFYAYVHSEEHMTSCSSSQTHCSLPSLQCGSMYNVRVIAVADHCNSSVPGMTQIRTAPCAPRNVSVSLVCDNNTAAVSWQHSPGAVSYTVTANGRDGDVKQCTANGTSCHLRNMHCAETYVITVTPYSNSCRGFDSSAHSYVAGPCPPTDVAVSLQCVGNVGHVTWTAAPRADHYVATVEPRAAAVLNHTCTSNGTGCSLADLQCGQMAVVTVVTVERGCRSGASLPFTFQTAICPPTTVAAATTCSNNDITVSWDASPRSGVHYLVLPDEDGVTISDLAPINQTSLVLPRPQCGELLTLAVAARDSACTSAFSQPVHAETAPCPPTNLTVRTDCGTKTGTLSWAPSVLAISYSATVTGTHGHVVSCSSNTTTCTVRLDCGQQYSALVIASSAMCSSSTGASVTFDSAPCLPDRVMADLDCSANSFAVQWRGSPSEQDPYTAIAIGSDGTRATCNSTQPNCTIHSLRCGLSYSVVVTTSSINCGDIDGSDYKMMSAPCRPDSVLADLQCSTNQAVVSWANAGPDQTQVVSAVDSRGLVTTCNSSSSNCTFDQLACGETYIISVVGHTDRCRSQAAVGARLNTAPCVPIHLAASVDCQTGITLVTWDSARGATSYTVYARGSLGHYAECNNTDTNCDFPSLPCGQDYNITVVARHDSCLSLVSETITATTGPCPLSDLRTSLDCDSNTAMVSWTPGSGILHYNASADAFDVVHRQSCSTSGSACNISSLRCGETYRVSVNGQGLNCPSPAQDWHRVTTAPCPPTQLRVDSSCDSNNISVSWQRSQGSVSYMAVAENSAGRRWSCNTSSTSCLISQLLCGQQYRVYAVGVDEMCMGAQSNVEVIHTAPCVPQDIVTHLDCLSGVLTVDWQSEGDVDLFHTSVVSSTGRVSSCQTEERLCVVRDMQCGLTYSVSVMAQDQACNSSSSPTTQVLTAPCPLMTFLPTVDCTTNIVSVAWNDSMPGVTYVVSAVDVAGRRQNCSGTDSGCELSTLECGTRYNITITPVRNGCVGTDSPTTMITTAPCVPRLTEVEIDCLANSAWVMYEESAGAEGYVVLATDGQGNVQTFECNSTSQRMCSLPPLECSQNLTFTLQAQDHRCYSASSNAVTTETAPCPPTSVESSVDCDNHTVSISWSPVPGAVSYTTTLEQMDGSTTCCTTSDTSCDISNLPCGEMYTVLVMAEGRTCNSSQREVGFLRSVPCVPQDLRASLRCRDNVASMAWNSTSSLGLLFKVRAVADDGHMHQCSSSGAQCDLTDLHCGETYTATVTAEDRDCTSMPSDSVTIKTVPCTPENISSAVDCEADALVVSWSESSGADSYIATVQDSMGHTTTCQGTTEGACNVTGLGCGQMYHVFVVSSDGYCDSPATPVVHTASVPCAPRHITAMMDCLSEITMVSWYPSDKAVKYVAVASSVSGHNVVCETSNTTCHLEGLLCGQSYSVSVEAVGENCSSIGYMTTPLVTEPCIPEHISIQYSLTIGQVTWDMTAGAESYTVRGETEQGRTVSCTTNSTYCALYNIDCGQMYTVNVTANNHVCQGSSTSTETAIMTTEPCPPSNVQTAVRCRDDVGTVSWEASFSAVGYAVHLAGRDGHSLSCYSNETFCEVNGLHCGVVYYANVIAIGETLNSTASTTVLLHSAPCAAENVAAALDCYNNTAEVSWSPSMGASSYLVTAVGANGHWATCETEEHQCDLEELECGQTYNVSLTSISSHCQHETHTNVSFSTRPCKPVRVGVDLQCGTRTANMYWEQREGVQLYMATASCGMGAALQCNSTGSTCQFSNLTCGQTYSFSVAAYTDTCCSETSSSVEIQTEPCQPTGLTLSGSCDNETVVLDWSAAEGASLYMVTVAGNLGYVTAFQTNETTLEAELPCGQLFNFTVKSLDDRCDSATSPPQEFRRGPCVPQDVQSYTRCEDSVGSVSWAESDGAESYMAIAVGQDGHTHMCTTNTTTCTWDDLHCGEHYTVHVVANYYLCSSMPSSSVMIRMAPCIPQDLTSEFNCSMKVGSLTWNASETAEFYIVTAETSGGHRLQLSTNDTWTYISEFQCGQDYFITVQAADSECTSRPSQTSELTSEPCPPTGVSSSFNCFSNIAVVSWNASAGAEFYTATLTQEDGEPSNSCLSDRQQCAMPNVRCGQNYTVTVVASNEECSSDPSVAQTLQSGPCVPTEVAVSMDCSRNQAVVSWSDSDGALNYKVSARTAQGATSLCESTDPTCTLTNLTCGQSYSVQVVAENDDCSSLPSPAVQFSSVPCTPNTSSVVLDCFTNSALLDWAYAEGALNYTATARSSDGHVSTCNTNMTNCELSGLQCGQSYHVTTVASDRVCSSPPSTALQLESVPCPPSMIVPVLDCSRNEARVEWQASGGADSYIVQALGVEEHEVGCETDSQSCLLTDLICGFTYNVSVIAVNSVCNVSQSNITQMKAAPCVPQQVEARVVCESGAVAVSWEPCKGALSYTTVAQATGGYASSCNSTETSCLLSDLLCGLNYSITVSASDETCSSAGSSVLELSTVPCVPTGVMAEMLCSNDTGVVSWEEEEGVSSYMVQAFGPDGHKTVCNSTAASCQLPNMHCGQLYNLTVTAQDGRCDNSHAYLNLQSAPCRPTNVQASLLCHSNSAAVTWEQASGALSYLAVGIAGDGSHSAECNNTMTHCDLNELQCGQTYNVSVFGLDESCSSVESDVAYMQTAPCPPQDVVVDAQCAEGAMTVSWSLNPDAQYYHVAAVSNTMHRLYCNSTGSACTISSLPCGRSYNITVLSVRDTCESEPSAVVQTSSAPCVPMNPISRLDCVTNSAWVTWEASEGALTYYGLGQEAGGHNSTCTSTSSHCNIPDLKCGTLYTFHITAANDHCHSNRSVTFELETGPCALTSINAVTQCNSDMILVDWEVIEGTSQYVVTAEGHDQSFLTCETNSTSCELQDVRCGMHYSIIVSTSSDKCRSLRSPPKKISTAPCVPENVTVVPTCEENGATVTWGPSAVAASYLVTATGWDGHMTSCGASASNCTLAALHCGQSYNLSITATGGNCTSQPGAASFRTVPCEPSDLTVHVDCATSSATLSWSDSEGAVEYFACAQSMDGDALYCDSAVSTCTIEGLECGGIYNFTVEASDGVCNSSFSPPVEMGAAPCAPTGLDVHMQGAGQAHWAMTSWDSVNCSDVEYLAEIVGRLENSSQAMMEVSSYWQPRTYFEFMMPCSTAYTLTVRARNSAGVSEPSSAFTGVTVPCAPQNVRYIGDAESAVLTWDESVLATTYTVYNVSGAGRSALCSTTELSCDLTNFDPDATEVTASNEEGESVPTRDITGPVRNRRRRDLRATGVFSHLDKGLEIPEGLTVTISGVSLHMQWKMVMGATEYTLVIEQEQKEQQSNKPPRVRTVEGDFYTETELLPLTTYCIRVAAKNAINQSNYSKPVCTSTASK